MFISPWLPLTNSQAKMPLTTTASACAIHQKDSQPMAPQATNSSTASASAAGIDEMRRPSVNRSFGDIRPSQVAAQASPRPNTSDTL